MIKVPHINGRPEYTPIPDYGSVFDGTHFNFFETQQEADEYYANLPELPPVQIDEVAAWRVRAALRKAGVNIPFMLEHIKEQISEGQAIVVEEALYGNSIDKYHPLTDLVCVIADLDKNELWENAKTVDK